MEEELIPLLSGPASATVILASMMWWFANKLTPAFQKYLEDQTEKLEKLVSALEKTVATHERTREVFEKAILSISLRLDEVESDVKEIKENTMEKK